MAEIGSGSGTGYPSALDTNNILEYDKESSEKTLVRADVVNDLAAAVVAIETTLGTDPYGEASDIAELLDYLTGSATAFTSSDTTPSISGGCIFKVPAAVTITDFDDEPSSGTKLIEIIADADNVVITHDATKIKLVNGIDVSLNQYDSITFRWDGSTWVERFRSLL